MYYVYIIKLVNEDYYSGFAKDLKRRLKEHNTGQVNATKNYGPFKLVNYFAFSSKERALKFEKYLKTGSGIAFRNKHLV